MPQPGQPGQPGLQPGQLPQRQRLNPKLTQRRPMPPPMTASTWMDLMREKEEAAGGRNDESESSSSEDSEMSEDTRLRKRYNKSERERRRQEAEERRKQEEEERKLRERLPVGVNPKAHLVHKGKFIKKGYTMGRAVPYTGMWSCCGFLEELSIYCPSVLHRDDMTAKMAALQEERQKQIEYKALKYQHVKALWDRDELGAEREREPTAEDKALEYAGSLESSFNAPMLMSWLYKNHKEEPTVLTGMGFLLHHLETAEGCALMLQHNAVGALRRIHLHYREHPPLQLQCITALCQLLDCNFTREEIVSNSTEALRMAFNVAHLHMNSRAHVDTAMRCIAQCCRSEVCRREIFKRRIFAYLINFCKSFSNTPSILRSCLKAFNWMATTPERIVRVCDSGVVKMILRLLAKHVSDGDVVAPAMLFLTRASEQHPPSLETILHKQAVHLIINALRALYGNEVLQLAGLKMLQTLSKTQEGWRQITETKGGWQSICQGTALGDSLVHDLPGPLHNPGWAIGDTPHLQFTDRIKILNAKTMQLRMGGGPKAAWTAHSLRDYMGIGVTKSKLAVNNEQHDTYFELLGTLELLPDRGEEREHWFQRLKSYEADNSIKLDDMCAAVMEIRRKEAIDIKKAEKAQLEGVAEEEENNGKAVYVRGQRVTTAFLSTTELTLDEMMRGVTMDDK